MKHEKLKTPCGICDYCETQPIEVEARKNFYMNPLSAICRWVLESSVPSLISRQEDGLFRVLNEKK